MIRLLYLLWLATFACAATLKGRLDASVLPLSPVEFSTTWLELRSLDSTNLVTTVYFRTGGSFVFNNISEGVYELSLHSITVTSPQYLKWRVDVSPEDAVSVRRVLPGHNIYKDVGPKETVPLELRPLVRQNYIIPRQSFSLFGMLKSPMMLLSLGSLVLVFVLPKMAANMDPEVVKELQQRQTQKSEVMERVENFDMASFLADRSRGKNGKNGKNKKD